MIEDRLILLHLFELLPTEIRYYIVSFFDVHSIHNFAFVNKSWHENEDLWRLLCDRRGIKHSDGENGNVRLSWKQLFTENTTYVQVIEGWHCKETVNRCSDDSPLHQVCMLGTGGVGLTAIIRQFLFKELFLRYDPTVEDMYFGTVIVNGERRNLEIMDTAGQEEYSALRDQYIKGYHIFVYVFSVTSVSTFNAIDKMVMQTLRAHENENIYGILIGNKIDLKSDRTVLKEEAEAKAKFWGMPYIETTIYDRSTILHAFANLIKSFSGNEIPTVRTANNTNTNSKRSKKKSKQKLPKLQTSSSQKLKKKEKSSAYLNGSQHNNKNCTIL